MLTIFCMCVFHFHFVPCRHSVLRSKMKVFLWSGITIDSKWTWCDCGPHNFGGYTLVTTVNRANSSALSSTLSGGRNGHGDMGGMNIIAIVLVAAVFGAVLICVVLACRNKKTMEEEKTAPGCVQLSTGLEQGSPKSWFGYSTQI